MATPKVEKVGFVAVYLGLRRLVGGKHGQVWVVLDDPAATTCDEPFRLAYENADGPTRTLILADVIRTIAGTSSVWAFVLACALAVTGCAPKGSSGPPRTFDPQAMTFLPGLTPHQEGRVREAWAFYLERWNRDEGPVAPWRSVTIVPGAEVRPGVGGEVRDGRRVFIASDPEEVATAVYHELGHLRLMDEGTDGDPQHLDPRWTVWQARRQQAVFDLIDWRVARYGRSGP